MKFHKNNLYELINTHLPASSLAQNICFILLFVSWQKWKVENIIIPQWFLNSFTIFNSLYFLIHEIWYFHHICSIVNIQTSLLFMLGSIEDRAHNMRNMCITCLCNRILNFTGSQIFSLLKMSCKCCIINNLQTMQLYILKAGLDLDTFVRFSLIVSQWSAFYSVGIRAINWQQR